MFPIFLTLVTIAIFLWLRWRKKMFSVFHELGIPGPEPSIFFGNYLDLVKKNHIVCQEEWTKKYGKIYGYYFGCNPIVVVSDTELLKKIQIGEFHKFINRPQLFNFFKKSGEAGDGFSSQLTNLRDRKWKEIRSSITPTFSTSKMRQMAPIINSAIDSLLENVEENAQKGKSFDIYPFYQSLTMDVIGRTAFGIQTNCQKNPNDPFLKSSKAIVDVDLKMPMFFIVFTFPELSIFVELYLRVLPVLFSNLNPFKTLMQSVKKVIKHRRENQSSRRQDLLQLLLDSQVDTTEAENVKSFTAGDDADGEKKEIDHSKGLLKSTRHMSDGEVHDNAVLFFLAGYETTSTALAFTTHLLVHYPEVQERVRQETNELLEREGKLDYYSVQKLQYLDQVMKESLRIYPPIFFFVNREVGEDTELDQYQIKEGMSIEVPVYTMHHDEEFWPNPEEFNPERFSPENKQLNNPMAFQSFGAGPRNCAGIRFAQMEFKLALARLLHRYRLVKCEESDSLSLNLKIKFANIAPGKGVYLRAEPIA